MWLISKIKIKLRSLQKFSIEFVFTIVFSFSTVIFVIEGVSFFIQNLILAYDWLEVQLFTCSICPFPICTQLQIRMSLLSLALRVANLLVMIFLNYFLELSLAICFILEHDKFDSVEWPIEIPILIAILPFALKQEKEQLLIQFIIFIFLLNRFGLELCLQFLLI